MEKKWPKLWFWIREGLWGQKIAPIVTLSGAEKEMRCSTGEKAESFPGKWNIGMQSAFRLWLHRRIQRASELLAVRAFPAWARKASQLGQPLLCVLPADSQEAGQVFQAQVACCQSLKQEEQKHVLSCPEQGKWEGGWESGQDGTLPAGDNDMPASIPVISTAYTAASVRSMSALTQQGKMRVSLEAIRPWNANSVGKAQVVKLLHLSKVLISSLDQGEALHNQSPPMFNQRGNRQIRFPGSHPGTCSKEIWQNVAF